MVRPVTRYDLRTVRLTARRLAPRIIRWTGFAGVLISLGAIVLGTYIILRTGLSWYPALSIVLFSMTGIGSGMIWRILRPGASWIEVDGSGIRLYFSNDSVRQLSWSDPGLRMGLSRMEDLRGRRGLDLSIDVAGSPDTELTPEAFDDIIRRARENGWTVLEQRSPRNPALTWYPMLPPGKTLDDYK